VQLLYAAYVRIFLIDSSILLSVHFSLFYSAFLFYCLGERYCIVMALSTCTYCTIWRRLAFLRDRLVRFGPHWTFSSESSMAPSMLFSFSFLIFYGILLCFPGIKKQLGWYYKSSAAYSWCTWYSKVLTLEAICLLCMLSSVCSFCKDVVSYMHGHISTCINLCFNIAACKSACDLHCFLLTDK
jgi:hypothetical protein